MKGFVFKQQFPTNCMNFGTDNSAGIQFAQEVLGGFLDEALFKCLI